MRCSNCGWNNPEGLDKCQKCNQPLGGENNALPKESGEDVANSVQKCTNCGYVISKGAQKCPYCGTPVSVERGSSNSEEQSHADDESGLSRTVSLHVMAAKGHNRATVADLSLLNSDLESEENQDNPDRCRVNESCSVADAQDAGMNSAYSDKQAKYTYKFECMDDTDNGCIDIVSDVELKVSTGDVILLTGLRYRKL